MVKFGNKYGNFIVLKFKIFVVVLDFRFLFFVVLVVEFVGVVRRVDFEVSDWIF